MDASIIESGKREAYAHYDGGRGYQPEIAIWAETGLVLADEFRDGNVPAGMDPLSVTRRAFAALPPSVTELAFRGDSACYNHDLLNWLRDPGREGGRSGEIRFAISADMSPELRARIVALPADAWEPIVVPGGARAADADLERCWAEVEFSPEGTTKRDAEPDRTLAIRIRRRQGALFADDGRYFAVVTNEWEWSGSKVISWHRAKAGTVELTHDILKNEVGAGTLPSGKFGANAAWFRLCVLTYNLIIALRLLALPSEFQDARPKRLRFAFFSVAARVTRSARAMVLRLVTAARSIEGWLAARTAIWAPLMV